MGAAPLRALLAAIACSARAVLEKIATVRNQDAAEQDLAGEGRWCFQTMACSFDADCGVGGKCGFNVASGDYRCLPAEYCP